MATRPNSKTRPVVPVTKRNGMSTLPADRFAKSNAKKYPTMKPRPEHRLRIVTAKDYVPGREDELLEGVQKLLISSMKILNKNIAENLNKAADKAQKASGWFWDTTSFFGKTDDSEEEKKCDDSYNDLNSKKSGDLTPNEMDGIVESMGFVLEVMDKYQKKVHQAAVDLTTPKPKTPEDILKEKVDAATAKTATKRNNSKATGSSGGDTSTDDKKNNNNSSWTENLQDMAKDMTPTDFIPFGGTFLSPNESTDEYPEGSEPVFNMSSNSPSVDVFLGSISSFLGLRDPDSSTTGPGILDGNLLTMESKLQYLQDVQTVSEACATQIKELDMVLWNNRRIENRQIEKAPIAAKERVPGIQSTDSGEAQPTIQEADSMMTNTSIQTEDFSVKTQDVEDQDAILPHQLDEDAFMYIKAARDKLQEYSDMADSLLKDKVKCVVSEYTAYGAGGTEDGDDQSEDDEVDEDRVYLVHLRKHFNSKVYDMDFNTYLLAESEKEMQTKILDTLHNSFFLRNVNETCHIQIRISVGLELSVSICNLVMTCLLSGQHEHRITEWGSMLFSKHVRALHAYVYEFCRCHTSTDEMLAKVESSALDAPPMDSNWERLFSAMAILKLERVEDYQADLLHPLFTAVDAKRILRLRSDFADDAIDQVFEVKHLLFA